MTDGDDPGWGPPSRIIVWLVPLLSIPLYRWKYKKDSLMQLRRLIVGQAAALCYFLIAFLFIYPLPGADAGVFPWLIAGLGVLCLVSLQWTRNRPLMLDSDRALGTSYRTGFAIGLGIAEVPALVSAAAVFVIGSAWIYVVGLALSLVGLAMVAPSSRELKRRQAEINATGSHLSLVAALRRSDVLE